MRPDPSSDVGDEEDDNCRVRDQQRCTGRPAHHQELLARHSGVMHKKIKTVKVKKLQRDQQNDPTFKFY